MVTNRTQPCPAPVPRPQYRPGRSCTLTAPSVAIGSKCGVGQRSRRAWAGWSSSRQLVLKRTEKHGVMMSWIVYLSGEIHTDWRQQIIAGSQAAGLAITFTSAVTDHQASDAAGDVLGEQVQPFWRDHQSAKVNAIRTRTHIQKCDLAVIRFGDQYKQWNAAFDAGSVSYTHLTLPTTPYV